MATESVQSSPGFVGFWGKKEGILFQLTVSEQQEARRTMQYHMVGPTGELVVGGFHRKGRQGKLSRVDRLRKGQV